MQVHSPPYPFLVGYYMDLDATELTGFLTNTTYMNYMAAGPLVTIDDANGSLNPGVGVTPDYSHYVAARAGGKMTMSKVLTYYTSGTDRTNYNCGSLSNAMTWCENYYANLFEPYMSATLPNGSYFDIINLETELNQMTGNYPTAFIYLINLIRSGGFTGLITCSANDPSLGSTPAILGEQLDVFGWDYYATLSNPNSQAQCVTDFTNQIAVPMAAYYAATGVPCMLGECNWNDFGNNFTTQQWINSVNGLFIAMEGLPFWTGVTFWRWPYNNGSQYQLPPTGQLSQLEYYAKTTRSQPPVWSYNAPGGH